MNTDWDWLRELGAVALVMGLLGAAMWALRQAGWFHTGTSSGSGLGARGSLQKTVLEKIALREPASQKTTPDQGAGKIGSAMRGILRMMRASAPAAHPRKMIAVDRLALTPQHVLHVVRVGERDLLLATHPQGCAFLTELGTAPGSETVPAAGGSHADGKVASQA